MTLKELNELYATRQRSKHPHNPYVVVDKLTDDSANELTHTIIEFINMDGGFARRISVEGRTIDTKQKVRDVIGKERIIGSFKRIPSSMVKGSADISACVPVQIVDKVIGVDLEIEIKFGNDRLSLEQEKYRDRIKAAKGFYMAVGTWDQFFGYYKRIKEYYL